MNDKFEIKDYLNYSISGFLWIVIILKFLTIFKFVEFSDLIFLNNINNSEIFITIILLFGTYLIGNLFRFSEKMLKYLTKIIYGNLYSCALYQDKEEFYNNLNVKKIKKGFLFYFCNKKSLSIGQNASNIINTKLIELNIHNNTKKNQLILTETYLTRNNICVKYDRLKNLKNLYESISFPIFLISIWFIFEVCCSKDIFCEIKITTTILILIILVFFVRRYKFLLSNYIKEVYRNFAFD